MVHLYQVQVLPSRRFDLAITIIPKRKVQEKRKGIKIPVTNVSIRVGVNSLKPVNPPVGMMYIAKDTSQFYICYIAGTWTLI